MRLPYIVVYKNWSSHYDPIVDVVLIEFVSCTMRLILSPFFAAAVIVLQYPHIGFSVDVFYLKFIMSSHIFHRGILSF